MKCRDDVMLISERCACDVESCGVQHLGLIRSVVVCVVKWS